MGHLKFAIPLGPWDLLFKKNQLENKQARDVSPTMLFVGLQEHREFVLQKVRAT